MSPRPAPSPAPHSSTARGRLRRVPVVHIVRGELVVPAELAGVSIERDERSGVQVVAQAALAVIVRARIAGAAEQKNQLRTGPAGDPCARAPGLPGIARPRLVARLARPGN